MNQKIATWVGTIVLVIVAITASVFVWMYGKNQPAIEQLMIQNTVNKKAPVVACTMEAKLCSDGSYVGRTGPNCEFAECPIVKNNSISENNEQVFDKKVLQDAVFVAVDNELKARYKNAKDVTWDKRVDFTSVDASLKAAKGKWWAQDAWDWIAWKQDSGSWKVLASLDGFNCKELDSVPSQYNNFFQEIIYPIDGSGMHSKQKYCY